MTTQQEIRFSPNGDFPGQLPNDAELSFRDQVREEVRTEMRADLAGNFVDSVEISPMPGLYIPATLRQAFSTSGLAEAYEDDPFSELPLDQPQPASGVVDGNAVAAFTDGVTGQQKQDVIDSMLLGQLAASARWDRESRPLDWYKYYRTVMENVGWVVPSYQWARISSGASQFTMDAAILKLLQAICSPNELETIKAAVEAVKALADQDRRLVIWERNTHENALGNFQAEAVGRSAQGTLSMKLGAYFFETRTNVSKLLWFRFESSSTKLANSRTTLVLNENVYAQVRQAIQQKLGLRAIDYVGGLDLGQI
jgi:hypothetical protein